MSNDPNANSTADFLMELRPLSVDHNTNDLADLELALIEAIQKKGGKIKRTIDRFDGQKLHTVTLPTASIGELKAEFPDLAIEFNTPIQLFRSN